ncbi:MAG: hypothetical protein OEY49_09615, partial [Candidatus Heimdallarchaeota archaeon]|nr:hypothetical protein [Candidatus Heimdallarchaeota archaeon]
MSFNQDYLLENNNLHYNKILTFKKKHTIGLKFLIVISILLLSSLFSGLIYGQDNTDEDLNKEINKKIFIKTKENGNERIIEYNPNSNKYYVKSSQTSSSTSNSNSNTQENDKTETESTITSSASLPINFGCTNPLKDILLVSHGQTTTYITNENYSFDSINEVMFGAITTDHLLKYNMIILEPNWSDYANLKNVLSKIGEALNQSSCLVVNIKPSGNVGSILDIDLLGTDYDRSFTHNGESIVNASHPFINGTVYGGNVLTTNDFKNWGSTDHGWLTALPTTQLGYNQILANQRGASMIEYSYGQGHVIVDTLTSWNGGWGTGNSLVATNILRYMNYVSELNRIPYGQSTGNVTYRFGTAGNLLNWNVYDTDSSNYTIYKDGISYSAGLLSGITTNTSITTNIDGLGLGEYNFTIVMQDSRGHKNSDEVWVMVVDGTSPVFNRIPADVNFAFGTLNHYLIWNATDNDNPNQYSIYDNGTIIDSGAWSNPTQISINIDNLSQGLHNITLTLNDISGNIATDLVWVNVILDTNSAVFNNIPGNQFYELGTIGNSITWNATDLFPSFYQLYVNNSLFTQSVWTSNQNITFNIDGLEYKNYNFTIVLFDTSGNRIEDTSIITSRDTSVPIITSFPVSTTYEFGSIDNTLNWTVIDATADNLIIKRNGVQIFNSAWKSGTKISINTDGLSVGTYVYAITLYDIVGNNVSHSVSIIVVDTTNPVIDTPIDYSYELGSNGNYINWTATDLNPSYYTIKRNSTLMTTGIWSSSSRISLNIDGLSAGFYNFTIQLYDTSGNEIFDSVIVSVSDTLSPSLIGPSDFAYEYGSIGNNIAWTATDANPSTYTIKRNESTIASGNWMSGGSITINIDNLGIGFYSYNLTVSDGANNKVSDIVVIHVRDSIYPTIDSPPNFSYEYGVTGNTISWTPNDLLPLSYKIYRNNTQISSGGWISGVPIILNIDNLGLSTYNFTIELTDTNGNKISDEVFITVEDTTRPTFISSTADYTYALGITGNSISWTAIDLLPGIYTLRKNGSIIDSGNWFTNNPYSINVDGLGTGDHNYTLSIYDTSGNYQRNVVIVSVTSAPVLTASSPDFMYVNDTLGNTVSWTLTDATPDIYVIYQDGIPLINGSWTSGVPITKNIDGLAVGTYTFMLWINDTENNIVTDNIIVTVTDRPNWVIQETNLIYSEGTTNNILSWEASDTLPDTYIIYKNGTQIATGNWANGTSINLNVDNYELGVFNITIVVKDLSANSITQTVYVTVFDNQNPTIIGVPADYEMIEDTTGNQLSWNFTDNHPGSYIIRINGVINITSSWNNADNITYSLDLLTIGSYTFELMVNDTSNNYIIDTVIVTVIDTTNPLVTNPSDTGYEVGSSGNIISWTPIDTNPQNYTVYKNSTTYLTGTWFNNTVIDINIDGLSLGYHNFTILLADTSLNIIQDTVIIYISDTTAPSINSPTDINYEQGSNSNVISWIISDIYVGNYTVYQNGSYFTSGNWINDTMLNINIDGLDFGFYEFSIYANDTTGNTVIDTLIVHVIDTTIPILSSPTDVTYEEGSSSNQLIWIITDLNNNSYTILLNNSVYTTGQWINNTALVINIDSLPYGYYNFTILAFDLSDNFGVDTVIVRVIDSTSPSITNPADISNEQGSTGNVISWIITDLNVGNYTVVQNGTFYASGNWINNTALIIDIDGLTYGYYNFTIIAHDGLGNEITDEIIIHVQDTTIPIVSSPNDIVYGSNNENLHYISWSLQDYNPKNFTVYYNGTLNSTGIWISGDIITVNVTGLIAGIYNFTIIVFDIFELFTIDEVIITVFLVDIDPPVISNPPDLDLIEGSTGNTLSWSISDLYPGNYTVYRNGSQIQNGLWSNITPININIDGLTYGYWNFTIISQDIAGNIVTDTVIVMIIDNVNPIFYEVPNLFTNGTEIDSGKTLLWNATDINAYSYTIFVDNIPTLTGMWNDRTFIIYVITLPKGIYNITIVVFDIAGNSVSNTVFYEVLDQTNPEFISSPMDTQIEEHEYYLLSWSAYDQHSGSYAIFVNGTSVVSDLWFNSGVISINLNTFSKGDYNFTLILSDSSGNFIVDTILVTILDLTLPTIDIKPGNYTYNEGETGNTIQWHAIDSHSDVYFIYRNGSQIQTGVWSGTTLISINIDGLLLGYYNFTIIFYDESNNYSSHFVIIEVIDENNPILISSSEDTTIIEGTSLNQLFWNVTDNHPDYYTIYLDGNSIKQNNWNNTNVILLNLDELSLEAGFYNITIEIFDSTENSIINTIFVEVIDNINPIFTSIPEDMTITVDSVGNYLSWYAYDLHSATYSIFIDEIFYSNGIWSSNNEISFLLDNLEIGTYDITITIYDLTGNIASDTVEIKVRDPLVTETEEINIQITQNVYEGDIEIINGTWSQLNSDDFIANATITVILYDLSKTEEILSFTTQTDLNGNFNILLNYTNIAVRNYIWEITFSKDLHETKFIDLNVQVQPHSYIIEIQVPSTLVQGESFFITAIVYYANENNSETLSFNEFISKQGKAEGVEVEFEVVYIDTEGQEVKIIKGAMTTYNGIAVIEFKGTDTISIQEITSISASISENEFGNSATADLPSISLPSIAQPNRTLLETLIAGIINQLYLVIMIFIVIIFSIALIYYTRKGIKKKFKTILKEMDSAKIELDSILTVRAVILQNNNGIPVYESRITQLGVDTALISGLISAMSAFLGEVGSSQLFGFETIERQGLSITSHQSNHSKLIFISENELPLVVLDKIKVFHKEIEEFYKTEILRDAPKMMLEEEITIYYEKTGLPIPLLQKLRIERKNIKRVTNIRSVSRIIKETIASLPFIYQSKNENLLPVTEIITLLEEQNLSKELIARSILLAYRNNILIPILPNIN